MEVCMRKSAYYNIYEWWIFYSKPCLMNPEGKPFDTAGGRLPLGLHRTGIVPNIQKARIKDTMSSSWSIIIIIITTIIIIIRVNYIFMIYTYSLRAPDWFYSLCLVTKYQISFQKYGHHMPVVKKWEIMGLLSTLPLDMGLIDGTSMNTWNGHWKSGTGGWSWRYWTMWSSTTPWSAQAVASSRRRGGKIWLWINTYTYK